MGARALWRLFREKEKLYSCCVSLSSEKLSKLEGSELRVGNEPYLALIAGVAVGH